MGLKSSTQQNQDWEHDDAFWKTYYEKTGDYSEGIWRTKTLNAAIERKENLKSRNIYYKYKGKEDAIPVKTNRFH